MSFMECICFRFQVHVGKGLLALKAVQADDTQNFFLYNSKRKKDHIPISLIKNER